MHTDAVLRNMGMQVLVNNLGKVEAEKFISLINREPFDYTEWQRNLFGDTPLEEFLKNAD